MTRDRMTFGGPQVNSELTLGGYVIYVSTEQPFILFMHGTSAERRFVAIVPPYVRHCVRGPRTMRSILVEAESVSRDLVRDPRFQSDGADAMAWAMRIEQGFRCWRAFTDKEACQSFDLSYFGGKLPGRDLDPRIALAADRIRSATGSGSSTTPAIAKDVGLSPSRLRHAFSEQVGVSMRSFRAWKRLRNAIHVSLQKSNIMELAMAAGYADATHLCHTVKLYFGEQPSFVFSHWRRTTFVYTDTSEDGAPPGDTGWGLRRQKRNVAGENALRMI